MTGLIVGSISPDFEYFIRMKLAADHGHSWLGLIYFDLPIALFLFVAYHGLIKRPLSEFAPGFLRNRMAPYLSFDWKSYLKKRPLTVMLSVLVGASSHILWDALTHQAGYFVEMFPWLQGNFSLLSHTITTHQILQHCSTFIGGFAVLYTIYKLPVTSTSARPESSLFWLSAFASLVFVLALRVSLGSLQVGHLIAGAISAFIISIFFASLFFASKQEVME